MVEERKPFAAFLQEQRRGGLHGELSESLQELVRAVEEHRKAGTLTLTVKVAPFGDGTVAQAGAPGQGRPGRSGRCGGAARRGVPARVRGRARLGFSWCGLRRRARRRPLEPHLRGLVGAAPLHRPQRSGCPDSVPGGVEAPADRVMGPPVREDPAGLVEVGWTPQIALLPGLR